MLNRFRLRKHAVSWRIVNFTLIKESLTDIPLEVDNTRIQEIEVEDDDDEEEDEVRSPGKSGPHIFPDSEEDEAGEDGDDEDEMEEDNDDAVVVTLPINENMTKSGSGNMTGSLPGTPISHSSERSSQNSASSAGSTKQLLPKVTRLDTHCVKFTYFD